VSIARAAYVVRMVSVIPAYTTPTSPIIVNALDEQFEHARLASSATSLFDPDAPYIISVGSISSYRGLEILLRAYAQFTRNGGRLRLIIGGPGPARSVERLRRAASSSNGNILVLGDLTRSEAIAGLSHAHTAVFPSTVEASPISLLEALAVAPRIVATSIPGHVETAKDMQAFITWVPASNASALAEALGVVSDADSFSSGAPIRDEFYRQRERDAWADTLASALIEGLLYCRS
jgi:glycosyltransferase involved in cell wall biosynthesis